MTLRTLGIAALLILLLVGLFVLFPQGCTQPDETRRVLNAQGYTHVEITGYRPFMGSKDEPFSTGFRAVSPAGVVVTGAVTTGGFRGHTVRLD